MTTATRQSDRSLDRMAVDETTSRSTSRSRSRGKTRGVSSDDAPADELNTTSSLRSKVNNNSSSNNNKSSRSAPFRSDASTADSSIPSIYRTHSNKDKLQCEYFKEDKTLTDGELPSLSLPIRRTASNVSAASSVSSIRARRLSPNSRNKHRAFWNQLDVEEDSGDEGKISGRATKKRGTSVVEEDDNDGDGGFISVILNICSAFGSPEETAPTTRNKSGASQVTSDTNLVKKRNYVDDNDDSEEDTTPKRSTGKKSHSSKGQHLRSSASTYDEDENTAIEVEYVHQNYDDENSVSSGQNKFLQLDDSGQVASYISREKKRDDSSSVNDKNAYLRALATKAKEDFQRKKGLSEQSQTEKNTFDNSRNNVDIDTNVDWSRPEFEGWNHSDKVRYLQLLQSNSPMDAVAIIASTQRLPADVDPVSMNLPIMYSTIEEDRDSILLARSVVSDLSMSSAFRNKKSVYSSMKESQAKPRGIILNHEGQRFDDRASDTSNSERNIKLASNLLSNLTKRKDGQWMEIQENVDEENMDQGIASSSSPRERQVPSRDETRMPSLSIQIKDPVPQVSSAAIESITLDPYRDSSEASVITSPVGGAADAMSVMSGGRSVYTTDTNATGASAWSVRSRKRPKGAAKKRIHEEPSTEQKKPAGWVETIQAVAEKTNQVWDPNLGWVNYSEPEKPLYEQESERIGPLKPPVSSKPYEDAIADEDNQSQRSHVPFPSRWERERDAMINNIDFISVAESEATQRYTNVQKSSSKPLLLKKAASFRKDRKTDHLLNLEEEDEEEEEAFDDNFGLDATAEIEPFSTSNRPHSDNTVDLSGERNFKKTISPIEKPPTERYAINSLDHQSMTDTKSLYDWIDPSGKDHTFEDRVYAKRQDLRDPENISDVISQPDSIELNRLEEKSIAKSVDEKQIRNDFRSLRIREGPPQTESNQFSSRGSDRMSDSSFPTDLLDKNSYDQQKRHNLRGIKLNSDDKDYVDPNDQLQGGNEDDEPFTQDNNNYFGEENSEAKGLQSGSFDNGFRVIKSTRNMSDFINNANQSISKNRKIESDARSISSQTSENLDKAQQWRKKLESQMKVGNQDQAPVTIRSVKKVEPKAEASEPIFVAAADDSSTFDFPKQSPRADPQFVFKKTNVEVQRKQGGASAQFKTAPINSKNTLKIKSVNVHERPSIPNDFSSVSSGSKDLPNVHGPNFGIDSILSRLQACVPESNGAPNPIDFCPDPSSSNRERKPVDDQELPQAHLDFMLSSRIKPPIQNALTNSGLLVSFCGRPDTIFEEDDEIQRTNDISALKSKVNAPSGRNDSHGMQAQTKATKTSSAIETTAYDDAPHLTNGIPRSKSEKWQQFMEKRSTSSNASISSRKSSVSDISKAAEKFAARKVEEIMSEFNNDVNKGVANSSEALMSIRSVKAAEDLAAARVQAMLMSSKRYGE